MRLESLKDPILDQKVGEKFASELRENVDLIQGVYEPFESSTYLDGLLAPVFFGSAINNFGITELLDVETGMGVLDSADRVQRLPHSLLGLIVGTPQLERDQRRPLVG